MVDVVFLITFEAHLRSNNKKKQKNSYVRAGGRAGVASLSIRHAARRKKKNAWESPIRIQIRWKWIGLLIDLFVYLKPRTYEYGTYIDGFSIPPPPNRPTDQPFLKL